MTQPIAPILPGEWLGLLGGGQLGRMFCMAAQSLGFRVCVLDPIDDSPAGAVADAQIVAGYHDRAALERLAARCRAVTTEFENVPAFSLEYLAPRCAVRPAASSVEVAQDRILEKRFVASHDIPVAPHAVIERIDDIDRLDPALLPGILKSARMGYDGKGQVQVATRDEAREAWSRLQRVPCVLEKRLDLRREISCVVCRGVDGETSVFPVAENEHRHGILAVTIAPARIEPHVAAHAQQLARAIAAALDYAGVLCVEFFVLDEGRLVVNEIAPRPHNSGHYTIDACVSSQFDEQARILAGLPLGSTEQLAPAVMLNLLGDLWFRHGQRREPPWAELLRIPGAKLHLYGKRDARPGRKMGHVTMLASSVEQALARANEAAALLGIAPAK
ncbi:MAG: 5-(carboxyamino)imidazole ribonucleotide synthase [Burkholderiaceae bacterium]